MHTIEIALGILQHVFECFLAVLGLLRAPLKYYICNEGENQYSKIKLNRLSFS